MHYNIHSFTSLKKIIFMFNIFFFSLFTALALYLQVMVTLLPAIHKDSSHPRLFGPDTAQTRAILQLVWQEWQSPVDGVAEMIRSALSTLLVLHRDENKALGCADSLVMVLQLTA